VPLDADLALRLVNPLVREADELADVFAERRVEATLEWRNGEVVESRSVTTEGLAARWRRAGSERLASVSRVDEEGLREAVRELRTALGRDAPPLRAAAAPPSGAEVPPEFERWRKRFDSLFERHAPRHRFRTTVVEVTRHVVPARGTPAMHARRLVSLEGELTAASRRRDEIRRFSFHGPDSDALADELRAALVEAAESREPPLPCPDGSVDLVLAGGCAALLFHEVLSHPLEAGAVSPLSGLSEARVAVAELDVRDDATRLDLFGGYESDDEGVKPRPVKLLDAGRLAGRLTTRGSVRGSRDVSNGHGRRAEAGDPPLPRGSNLVVASGSATREDLMRRLGNGLWIDRLDGGSIELASGSFRLHFPRARRVRRGRFSDEFGPGILSGEVLPALKGIEAGLGREVRPYRALGWCARSGQVVPVQGESPDVLFRALEVRAAG